MIGISVCWDSKAKQLVVQRFDELFYRLNADTWIQMRVTGRPLLIGRVLLIGLRGYSALQIGG